MGWFHDDIVAVKRLGSTKVAASRRWFVEEVLMRVWRWIGQAVKIAFLAAATVIYLVMLLVPEAFSVAITAAAYSAYKLSYRLLFMAARLYLASVHLAVAARRIRDLEPHGLFAY
jgi:hypothetical protein